MSDISEYLSKNIDSKDKVVYNDEQTWLLIKTYKEDKMSETELPKATAKRLPLYQRAFKTLAEVEKERVSSAELSDLLKIDSTTIRRDFSYLGRLGRRGYGYDVLDMEHYFDQLLQQETLVHVAIIGIGNLGHALLKQSSQTYDNIRITAGFDVKEDLINTIEMGVPIFSSEEITSQLPRLGITTAILTDRKSVV